MNPGTKSSGGPGAGTRRYNYTKAFGRWDDVSTLGRFGSNRLPGLGDLTAGNIRCILHGWAFRCATFADGRRYVRNFLLPGDLLGCPFDLWPRAMGEVVAATDLECVDFREAEISRNPERRDRLQRQVESALIKEMALLNGIAVRMGKMTAPERTIHLFLELLERHREAELVSESSFWFPVPQDLLADCLGISKVHLNRTLQQLRQEKLIRLESSMLELFDVEHLMKLVDYEPMFPTTNLP